MATKKSVFLSDTTVSFINATTSGPDDDGPKWSNAINASIEQYRYLLASAMPELTDMEWQAILNTYAGCYMPAHNYPPRIASDMMDDMGEINIDNVEPERAALIKRIHAMSQLEQMAILYFNQIFWLNDWNHCADFNEVKTSILQKFIDN